MSGQQSLLFTDPVTIENVDGEYYKVELDFTQWSHFAVGIDYAMEILEVCPDYESMVDSLLDVSVKGGKGLPELSVLVSQAGDLLQNMPLQYVEEIAGMNMVFNSNVDQLGDGRLSSNEMLVFQVFHDVLDPACSAAAVYGDSSTTGETLVGRNLDWYDLPQLSGLHTVTLFNNGEDANSVIGMGFLGQVFTPSAFSEAHVSAAVLDSDMDIAYLPSAGRDAYLADMRYALETQDSVETVGASLLEHNYTHSFLTLLADTDTAAVLEADQEFPEAAGLRYADSVLREGMYWPFEDAVVAVNSNLLPGTTDNHTGVASNEKRFASYQTLFSEKLASGGTMDMADMQSVMSYTSEDGVARTSGAIYRSENDYPTVQSYVLDMGSLDLLMNFGPTPGNLPEPVYTSVFSGNPFTNFFSTGGTLAAV